MSTDIEPQAAPAQPDTSNGATDATVAKSLPSPLIEGVNEEDRLGAITQGMLLDSRLLPLPQSTRLYALF